ncbi:MAG TPA: hypothetical protein VHK88_16970 [Aquihabitans sp.]|jgi:hypothetical protein|nr:hypothetical protein [Aquihabitans sp.]
MLVREPSAVIEAAVARLADDGGVDERTARLLLERLPVLVGRSVLELSRLVLAGALSYANVSGERGPRRR